MTAQSIATADKKKARSFSGPSPFQLRAGLIVHNTHSSTGHSRAKSVDGCEFNAGASSRRIKIAPLNRKGRQLSREENVVRV